MGIKYFNYTKIGMVIIFSMLLNLCFETKAYSKVIDNIEKK